MSVMVRSGGLRRVVDEVGELDEFLDGLAADNTPVLVALASDDAVMNVGVGRRDVAVALFRDADGRSWAARWGDGPSLPVGAKLEFAKDGTPYRFFAEAAIDPAQMREAAREFVRSPGVKPSVLTWASEGPGSGLSDGGTRGR